MTVQFTESNGRRVMFLVAAAVIAVAGVLGAVIGVILPAQKDVTVARLGPIAFSITPITFAVYGIVTVSIGLAVLFGLVRLVSRYDDRAAGE